MPTTRRQLLIAIAQLASAASAASLAACSRSADKAAAAGSADLELLASVAYDILPYTDLPAESYVSAARKILDMNDATVAAGLKELRAASHDTPWKDVAEAERIVILKSLQDTPFFAVVRVTTVQTLLRDPATFAIVGYGGSTVQYGGYLNRGFDDISWLPASRKN